MLELFAQVCADTYACTHLHTFTLTLIYTHTQTHTHTHTRTHTHTHLPPIAVGESALRDVVDLHAVFNEVVSQVGTGRQLDLRRGSVGLD